MGEEKSTFRWAVGTLIALLTVCVSAAAIYFSLPKSEKPAGPNSPQVETSDGNNKNGGRNYVPPPPSRTFPGVVVPAPTARNGRR